MKKLTWLPPLLTRASIGFIFLQSGWGKLGNLAGVTKYFASLGIPAANLQAPLVAGAEVLCGVLLLVGLFTRFAAVPLLVIMAGALLMAKAADIRELGDLLSTLEFQLILGLIWLAVLGPGRVSVDTLIFRRREGVG